MKKILLAFDGSAEARFAAEICWSMAQKSGCSVTAQHVVDTLAAWNFLQFSLAGLTGSGPYFAAYETICQSLRSLGVTLMDVYTCHADSKGIEGLCVLDEGEALSEIRKRAMEHDLVIVGHRQLNSMKNRARSLQSLCEELTKDNPCPLLIVRQPCGLWKNLRIVVGRTSIADTSVDGMLQFCAMLDMTPEIFWVKDKAQSHEEFLARLNDTISPIHIMDIPVQQLADSIDMSVPEDTLVVIPSLDTDRGRRSSYSGELDQLIHNMTLPAVLIWPSETAETKNTVANERDLSITT
ncbi:hypothetical protein GC174_03485 [bacterium]|nr:hypothetical protein [bacterium]